MSGWHSTDQIRTWQAIAVRAVLKMREAELPILEKRLEAVKKEILAMKLVLEEVCPKCDGQGYEAPAIKCGVCKGKFYLENT